METNDGGPAFPTDVVLEAGEARQHSWSHGMSLRDYFAGQALVGLTFGRKDLVGVFAREAFAIADAMLAVREGK